MKAIQVHEFGDPEVSSEGVKALYKANRIELGFPYDVDLAFSCFLSRVR